ncbi:hypothetical protein BKI52_20250 [marine bacterium AO1-C]|nr:hypothetical protein BKI52_20250 [marine bacterium AO1-C]
MDRRNSLRLQQTQLKDKNRKRRKSVGDVSDTPLNRNNSPANDTGNVSSTTVTTTIVDTSNNQNDANDSSSGGIVGITNNQNDVPLSEGIVGITNNQGIDAGMQIEVIRSFFPDEVEEQYAPDETANPTKRAVIQKRMVKIMNNLNPNEHTDPDQLMETIWFRLPKRDRKYIASNAEILTEKKKREDAAAEAKKKRDALVKAASDKINAAKEKVSAGKTSIQNLLAQNGGDAYLNQLVKKALGTQKTYGLAKALKKALSGEDKPISTPILVNDIILREYIAIAANEIITNTGLYTDDSTDEDTGDPVNEIYLDSLMQYLIENTDKIEAARQERDQYLIAVELPLEEIEAIVDAGKVMSLSDGATLGIIKNFNEQYGQAELEEVSPSDQQTVTQTHLTMMGQTPALQRQVTSLGKLLPIDQMIEKEQEMQDDYYVFYQAHPATYRFLRRLNERLHNKWSRKSNQEFDVSDDFTWLRSPETFKDKGIKTTWGPSHWRDEMNSGTEDNKHGLFLLSTNLSTFGNSLNPGESTASFFLNKQEAISYAGTLFGKAAQDLNIDTGWVLMKMAGKYLSGASMMQIFVPKAMAEDVGFLSTAGGKPVNAEVADFLDSYTQNPGTVGPLKDFYQARLLMAHEAFSNPESGIKIFEYNDWSKEKNNQMLAFIDNLARQAGR